MKHGLIIGKNCVKHETQTETDMPHEDFGLYKAPDYDTNYETKTNDSDNNDQTRMMRQLMKMMNMTPTVYVKPITIARPEDTPKGKGMPPST